MNPKLVWLTLALVLGCAVAQKTSYVGYKLLRLFPNTDKHFELIAELEHNPDFDMWTRIKTSVKVALSPGAFAKYVRVFKMHKIDYEILQHNLQELFDNEERSMKRSVSDGRNIQGTYARYNDHVAFVQNLAEDNKDIISHYSPGKSYEGRNIIVAKIGTASSKRKVWIDCGIHAREWVSPATCNWVIDKLVTEYKRGVTSTVDLLNHYEFHIMPVMNPDGYEFSHTTTRMWRKNRRVNSGSPCIGVDLNRNFGHQWSTGGSSPLPCADTYAGPTANSEPETQAVQAAINAHLGEWDAFLTIHSYGKWLFTPYGYSGAILPPDFKDLNETAEVSVKALQAVNNEKGWVTGSSSQILYVASGGSEDWTYAVANIKYSYCFELRPGEGDPDYGEGFSLSVGKASLAGEETYQGIKAMLNKIRG